MSGEYVLGFESKLYRNTATYESPTWVEVDNIRDNSLTLEAGEADLTTRANGGWEAVVAALRKGAVEFEMVWDKGDANFQAFRTAFFARGGGAIDVMILDGDRETADVEGLRATMCVLKFTRNEELAEGVKASVSMKPTYSAHKPEWVTMPLS